MLIVLISGSVVIPLIMLFLQMKWQWVRSLFNIVAMITLLIFSNIAAFAIYKVIQEHMVFMTTIHAVFLNSLFLVTGGYIGIFIIYRLMLVIKNEW